MNEKHPIAYGLKLFFFKPFDDRICQLVIVFLEKRDELGRDILE